MYNSNNAAIFRDTTWAGQSTVRRYCIESAPPVRQVQSDPFAQENSDVLKFYVVSRCTSYDKSFLIPQPFSYLSETDAILNSNRKAGNDIFDEGISSSDDDLFNVSVDRPAKVHSETHEADLLDGESPGFETFVPEERTESLEISDHSYDPFEDTNQEDFVPVSPKEPIKYRIDDKKGDTDIRRDANIPRKPARRKPSVAHSPKLASTGKLSQTPFRDTFKPIKNGTGAYEISNYFKKSRSQPPKPNISNQVKVDYDNVLGRDTEFKHDSYDMDDFGGDDDYFAKTTPPPRGIRRKTKKNADSSALLNTWYLSRESYSNFDINWKHLKEYNGTQHNTRYPKRTRLPPVCHWDSSNLSASAVRIYKTEGSDAPLSERSPNVSLLIEEKGNLIMHIAEEEQTNNKTEVLPIADYSDKPKRGAPPGAPPEGKKKRIKRTHKVRSYLSVDEALDILNNAPDDYPKNKRPVNRTNFARDEMANRNTLASGKLKEGPKVVSEFDHTLDSVAEYDGKLIGYKSIYRPDDVEAQVHDGNTFKLMIMAQFRTSIIVIPSGNSVNFGNVNSNLIFGYVFSGESVKIKGLEYYNIIDEKDFFYLPMYNEWSIENNSKTRDAVMFLSFANV